MVGVTSLVSCPLLYSRTLHDTHLSFSSSAQTAAIRTIQHSVGDYELHALLSVVPTPYQSVATGECAIRAGACSVIRSTAARFESDERTAC